MAYCVHCGVKLSEAEKTCPLCGTKVLDPGASPGEPVEKAFHPRTPEQEIKRSRRFFLSLYLLTMLVPAGVCLLINLLLAGGITWSVYPSVALTLLFLGFLVPTLAARYKIRLSLAVDFVLLSLYAFMCERLSGAPGWFFPIALPALVFLSLSLFIIATLFARDKLGKLTGAASLFLCAALLCTLLEALITLKLDGRVLFRWSPFVSAPCAFLSALMFFINSYRPLREELRRRMHF